MAGGKVDCEGDQMARALNKLSAVAVKAAAPGKAETALREALAIFFQQQQVQPATLHISDWMPDEPGAKRRRLLLQRRPEGTPCTY